ncbi:DUF4428 domain-containing protein [Clostridium sardiniense]|uniref:DUF4428 domain-containing protein n=1 Tax=Clostridium sardiniense TaxID=29369 RepID=UPI003D331AEE
MGLFSSKEVCSICGEQAGVTRSKCADGIVCSKCKKKVKKYLLDGTNKVTAQEIIKIIEDAGDDWDKCDVCGNKLGLLNHQCQNGFICGSCSRTYTDYIGTTMINYKKINIQELQSVYDKVQIFKNDLINFKPTKSVGIYLCVNDETKKWYIPTNKIGSIGPRIFKFSDLVSYEVLEDGDTITSGGLGRAVAGGVLFGGVGAIVGGVTGKKRTKKLVKSLSVRVVVDTIERPYEIISLITKETKTNSSTYTKAMQDINEIVSVLEIISRQSENSQAVNNIVTGAKIIDENKTINENINSDQNYIFCRMCGSKLASDSKFCSSCGEKL